MTEREIWAAVIGFVFGYVGWYSALRLVPTVAAFLIAPWGEGAKFVRAITLVIVTMFAIAAMLALLALGAELVAIAAADKPRLMRIALLSSLAGWVTLGALGTVGRQLAANKPKRRD